MPTFPPPLCSFSQVTAVVHVDRISATNTYWLALTAVKDRPAAGTLRLITDNGHIDVAFADPGPLEVNVPAGLLVLGAYAREINGTPCAGRHGVSAKHYPGKPSDLPNAATVVTTGPEIPDDDPRCDRPFTTASVIDAAIPTLPPGAVRASGDVMVVVTIDETGKVVAERILRTSDASLNTSALTAARQSTFAPQRVLCTPVGGEYVFAVTYR